jgi:hypothetical protein
MTIKNLKFCYLRGGGVLGISGLAGILLSIKSAQCSRRLAFALDPRLRGDDINNKLYGK